MEWYETEILSQKIINTVIENSRDDFLQANITEDVLLKLRGIWERKVSERNVIPSGPAVVYSQSLTDNAEKKKCPRRKGYAKSSPGTPLCQASYNERFVPNIVCNRSMPLLTIEEDEEYTRIIEAENQKLPSKQEPNQIITILNGDIVNNVKQARPGPNKIPVRKRRLKNYILSNKTKKIRKEQEPDKIITRLADVPNDSVRKKSLRNYCKLTESNMKLKEANNNGEKQKRGRSRKYPRVVQVDGVPSSVKFKVKPKYPDFPLKAKQIKVEDGTAPDTDDDLTDGEDNTRVFDCNNIIHCQYEMVKKIKNKWKIELKCGVMHLKGKDYAFNKANGTVLW